MFSVYHILYSKDFHIGYSRCPTVLGQPPAKTTKVRSGFRFRAPQRIPHGVGSGAGHLQSRQLAVTHGDSKRVDKTRTMYTHVHVCTHKTPFMYNVGKTRINHPPVITINRYKQVVLNHSQMGGLLLFYPHYIHVLNTKTSAQQTQQSPTEVSLGPPLGPMDKVRSMTQAARDIPPLRMPSWMN